MGNVFESHSHSNFTWDKLGDIDIGRPNLGGEVPVKIYRIFEYALFDVLCHELGVERAQDIIRKSGHKAGIEFATHALDLTMELDAFLADLAAKLLALKVGVLRVENIDCQSLSFTVTVGEDLDCGGLPVSGEVVCNYDEGFIAGIFEAYTKQVYEVREIDCWASGDKVCRFSGTPRKEGE